MFAKRTQTIMGGGWGGKTSGSTRRSVSHADPRSHISGATFVSAATLSAKSSITPSHSTPNPSSRPSIPPLHPGSGPGVTVERGDERWRARGRCETLGHEGGMQGRAGCAAAHAVYANDQRHNTRRGLPRGSSSLRQQFWGWVVGKG